MSRKILLLALVLAICWCAAVPAGAISPAQEATLRSDIQKQFDAYAASLNKTDVHKAAVRQLLNHALDGHGKHLSMGESAAVTASMFNSAMFRVFAVETMLTGLQIYQAQHLDRVMVGTNSLAWHDFSVDYRVSHFLYNDTVDMKDDEVAQSAIRKVHYSGAINANDKAMMLVVGGAKCRFRMIPTNITVDHITYRVEITVSDTFSFDSDYEDYQEAGYDTSTSNLINLVGKLLDRGLIDTYQWSLWGDFELTVPNMCTHESSQYRWAWNGTDLEAVKADGFAYNPLERIQTEKKDGTLDDPYYKTQDAITLRHNLPWVVEFKMRGSGMFMMSPGKNYTAKDKPYLLKSWGHIVGGEYFTYEAVNEATGATVKKGGRKQYGVDIGELGIQYSQWHVYRLENRIAADGSNMVWLWVDGVEVGPMDTYFLNKNSANETQATGINWFNGRSISINYIFNDNCGMTEKTQLEYVAIWENGEGNGNHSFFRDVLTAPNCTAQGYMQHTCVLCGGAYRDSYTAALGHRYEKVETVAPTCTADGFSTYRCTVCQHSYRDELVPALGHAMDEWAVITQNTCLQDGQRRRDCLVCDHYETEQIPAAGHSIGAWYTYEAAGCVSDGISRRDCAACAYCETQAIPATGHTLSEWFTVTEATCTADGALQRNCVSCAYSETQAIPATGHALCEWFIITEAACTADGVLQRNCANCSHAETQQIPSLGHAYVAVDTQATCTVDGYTTYTCDRCGDSYVQDRIAATGHSWNDWETIAQPDCESDGARERCCMLCGEKQTEVLEQLSHIPGPAATEDTDQVCTRCLKVLTPAFGIPSAPTLPTDGAQTEPITPEEPTQDPRGVIFIVAIVAILCLTGGVVVLCRMRRKK